MANRLKGVTAAVLAGGLGTRLRPVVGELPKVLAPVRGRPWLAFLLDQLADAGLREVILLTGRGAEQVRAALGDAHGELHLRYATEPGPLGTAGALRHALPLLAAPQVLLLNGDSYADVDLSAFLAFHRRRPTAASLVMARVTDAARYGRLEVAPDGRVLRFREKGGASPGWVNAGVYLLDRRLIESIPAGRAVSLEREMLPRWLTGADLAAFPGGRFLDIGMPESYAEAEAFFRRPALAS
jgi:D-glycero-alpha-D-manno-heptose 1-phosphate guanylyltransferase